MAKHKNNERYKITGDKKVRVIIEFNAGDKTDDNLAMKIAADYLNYYATSGVHKSFGYGIEVQHEQA